MVHSGSAIAAGVSQGRSITFRLNTPFGKHFRNDREKRDFVCAGKVSVLTIYLLIIWVLNP